MYTNKDFLFHLNDFQNKAIEELINNKGNFIFVKSFKFTGKTVIANKLYEKVNDDIVFYHTGCNPKFFNEAFSRFKKLINNYTFNSITVILDEFYNCELLDYVLSLKNITCYVFTNDIELKYDKFINFNYYRFYSKFINNEFGKYLNIHQVMNKDKNFDTKNEKLRRTSTSTITNIKYKNNKIKDFMEF